MAVTPAVAGYLVRAGVDAPGYNGAFVGDIIEMPNASIRRERIER